MPWGAYRLKVSDPHTPEVDDFPTRPFHTDLNAVGVENSAPASRGTDPLPFVIEC